MSLRNNKSANWKRAYNKLAEEFFDLQHEFDEYKNQTDDIIKDHGDPWAVDEMSIKTKRSGDAWSGCACGNSSTCGTTFTTDPSGVTVENEKVVHIYEGRYTVLVKREGV